MRLACLLAVLLVGALGAQAHDLLLDPSHGHQDARAVVSMKLFLGHAGEGQALQPSEKAATYVCVTPDGKRHVPGAEGAGLGLFDAAQAGVYLFGYATRPSLLHVAHEDLLEVVQEAGAQKTLGKELAKTRMVRPWRVEERHHAKSVVVIDAGASGRIDRALQLDLELFLAVRPDRIVTEKPVQVRLTEASKPVVGARIVAFPRNAPSREVTATTDAKGLVSVTLPEVGAWAVRAVRLVRADRKHAAEWIVSRATLTFEVPEPAPKPSPAPKKGSG